MRMCRGGRVSPSVLHGDRMKPNKKEANNPRLYGSIRFGFSTACFVGAFCAHAILNEKIGVYRCPFGSCFRRRDKSD